MLLAHQAAGYVTMVDLPRVEFVALLTQRVLYWAAACINVFSLHVTDGYLQPCETALADKVVM